MPSLKLEIIFGKAISVLLLLMLPYYVDFIPSTNEFFYAILFTCSIGIFGLRLGQEYYLFNKSSQTDYLAARRTIKCVLFILILALGHEYIVLFLLVNLAAEVSFQVIRYRIEGRYGILPYLSEGLLPLVASIVFFIPTLSYPLALVSMVYLFRGSYSLNFLTLVSGLGTMSNTVVSLLVANVLPLVLAVDMENFFIYSRAAGIVGMSSTYGNLLYQKEANTRPLKYIRKISLAQLPIFLLLGVTYVAINNVDLVWTFFIASIVNVITGPIQIDLLRMKNSVKILQSSVASILLFIVISIVRIESVIYVGLAFSSIMVLENLLSYIFYAKARDTRS